VEATGEARLGNFDTVKEVKDQARRDAQGKAVEQVVGVFIKSHTLVSNSQVAEDLIYAAVRGKITQEKTIAADSDAKNRHLYKITIKARVEPIYPEKGGDLSAKFHLFKTDLKEGNDVKIFYSISEDAYVYIFSIAEEKIKVVATREKEPLLPLGFQEVIFQVYDEKSTRMIGDLVRRINQIEISDWTEVYHHTQDYKMKGKTLC
jgi:hypothetical protein